MISLFVIAIGSLVLSAPDILGIEVPDVVQRIAGIGDLAVVPVLVYPSIKLKKVEKK